MPKVRIDVSKLENPTAEYISLVERGANRRAFSIIKQHKPETDMIDIGRKLDLANLSAVLKSADDKAAKDAKQSKGGKTLAFEVDGQTDGDDAKDVAGAKQPAQLAGIVVEKGDWLNETVTKALGELGLDMDNPIDNDDGSTTFVNPEYDDECADECVVAKMSGNTLAIIDGIDVEAVLKGTTFETAYEDLGFLPSAAEAMNTSLAQVKKALVDSTEGTLEAVRKSNGTITENANRYAKVLQESLPVAAFKADEIINAAKDGPGDEVQKAAAVSEEAWDKMSDEEKKKYLAAGGVKPAETDAEDMATKKAADEAAAAAADSVPCPACEAKHTECNMCTGGKVTKAEAEAITKLVKKADPAAVAAATKKKPEVVEPTAAEKEAAAALDAQAHDNAAQHLRDAAGIPPSGVDAAAWKKMSPEERAFVKSSISKEEKPAAVAQVGDVAGTVTAMLKQATDGITASLTALTKAVADIGKVQKAQGEQLAAVEGKVAKTEKVLKGTVIGGVPSEDGDEDGERVEKNEGELGMIDTAFQPNVRRVQKGYLNSLLDERRGQVGRRRGR